MAGKPHRVLNQPWFMPGTWVNCGMFSLQSLSPRADEWPCSDGIVGLDNLLSSVCFLFLSCCGRDWGVGAALSAAFAASFTTC